MNKNIRQKLIISAALMIAATASAFAQGNGLAGIREIHIKISRFIVTFAYEEFFEGYATRRRIMQQITN